MSVQLEKVNETKINNLLQQIDKSIIPDNPFNRISSRALDSNNGSLVEFHTFDDNKLTKIAENMTEINRATRSLGRKNTQTSNRLMTLTMLSDVSPYEVLKQCLAQIENKRSAIKENRYKIMKERVKIEQIQRDIQRLDHEIERLKNSLKEPDLPDEDIYWINEDIYDNQNKIILKQITMEQKASGIADSMIYIEGALKDIASFQSSYFQICRNNNIPEDWDEKDLELAEISHHLRIAFLHSYRDIMAHGKLNMGTLEYLQQLGVHPNQAYMEASKHISKINEKMINKNVDPITGNVSNVNMKEDFQLDYEEDLEKWLDEMVEKNKHNYRKVLKRLGLDNLIEDWYMYLEEKNK